MSEAPAVEALLDHLHAALIMADFATLQTLAPQLEAALTHLGPQPDRSALERLRRKAERNAACALAAGRGVRSAQRRLAEIRQAASGLVTYDNKGNRRGSSGPEGVSRRY